MNLQENGRRINLVLLISAGLAFVLLTLQFRTFFIDDSYITYRYADVWNRSGVLSFNVEDTDPVDGFTSFLWVCISAAFLKVGMDPLIGTRLLGVASGLGAIILTYLIGLRLQISRNLIASLCFVLALSSETAMWASSGMETSFFSALLLLSIYLMIRDMDSETRPKSPIAFAMLCLARPEGIAFSGLAFVCFAGLVLQTGVRQQAIRKSIEWIVLFGLLFGSYFLWHWNYYGYPFPNSYYAKAFPGEGSQYAIGFLKAFLPLVALSVLSLLMLLRESCWRRTMLVGLFVSIVAVNLAAIVGIHPVMAWDHRLLLHLLPVLILASAPVLDRLLVGHGRFGLTLVAVLCIGTVLYTTKPQTYSDRIFAARNSSEQIRNTHFVLGEWLRENIDPGTVMATIDTGVIPFVSRGRFVDIANVPLNNKRIVHGTETLDAIWGLNPRIFILGGIGPTTIKHDELRARLVQEATRRGWEIAGQLKYSDDYYLIVYVEPQLARRIESEQHDLQSRTPSLGKGRWHEAPEPRFPGADAERAALEKNIQALGYLGNTNVKAKTSGGVTFHNADAAFPGTNLYISGHGPGAFLIDMNGEVLHEWWFEFDRVWAETTFPDGARLRGRDYWRRVKLLPNGDLIANFEYLGLIRVDRDSRIVWANPCRAHHDLEVDDDGSIYTLARRDTTLELEEALRDVITDDILVMNEDGTIRERFDLLKTFDNSGLRHMWEDRDVVKDDILHTNSIRLIGGQTPADGFADGSFLLSFANIDAIAVLDPRTRKFTWTHQDDFKAQHDPRIVSAGSLLLFDNKGVSGKSRVMEIDLTTLDILWTYQGTREQPFYTGTCGTARRLPNGNTLICESDKGRAFEVNPDGLIVWEFQNPHRAGQNDQYVATLFDVERLEPVVLLDWLDRS